MTSDSLFNLIGAVLFAGFVVVTLFGAVMAAVARRLIRNVTGLAMCFSGLAGLYYFLNSPFLALMQILIYVGAICVVIMFAMMLTELNVRPRSFAAMILTGIVSLLVAGVFAFQMIHLVIKATWMPIATEHLNSGSIQDLGRALLTQYAFPFELISVVLLISILGALAVARSGRNPQV